MSYIEVGSDVKLYVQDLGKGKPIVFVHGWPLNHKMWEYQQTSLPAFGYRCISPDLRGFGLSDSPWGDENYTYDTFASDLKAVLDKLNVENATLVGFSMGGGVALHYMARYNQQHIARLVLAGPATPSYTKRSGFDHGVPTAAVDGLITGIQADRAKTIADFGKNFFGSSISSELADQFQGINMEASAHGTISAARNLRDSDLRADLEKITVPTLILHGKKDKIVPFELGEYTHQQIKGSQLVAFEHSGHGLVYDEMAKFNDELRKFIG